jgi:hypothetical protein
MSYQPLFLGLGTAVFRTNTITNILEGETADLRVGQLIKFTSEGNGFIFGGVAANTVYYIKEIVNSNEFKISATLNGDALELNDGEGFMLVRPIQREQSTESLRKVDSMLKEIYTGGLEGDGVGILSVQDDASPMLGGNLSLDGNDIVGTGDINITGSINATVLSGGFRGTLAGSLTGPVDGEGVRTGNPTIDGLPFELGNPVAGQVIAWDGPNEKFRLASISAVSGSDTLDDVLLRGNTSNESITIGSLTTDTLVVNDGLNYSVIVNPPTIPTDVNQLDDVDGLLGGTAVDIGNFTFAAGDASLPIGDTMTLSTYRTASPIETRLTLSPTTESSLLAGNNLKLGTGYGTGFEQYWQFGSTGSITFPDATVQSTAFTGSRITVIDPNDTEIQDINTLVFTGDGVTITSAGNAVTVDISGGGGGTLPSRTTASATTGALLVNAIGNISITGFKTYALLAMTVEIPAWVRLYTSSAARTADASRLETEDPLPGSGVIAEVITTSNNQTVLFTPATIGFNGATPATTTIFAAVKNKGSGLATIQVTLNLLQLEA